MKVNEIFYSLQGEGRYTGTPAVFVRFSGCNLACDFCDTDHQNGTDMTEREIVDSVLRYPARHIVLTGGEPALQLTPTLLRALKNEGKIIHMETNGTCPLPDDALPLLDWITVSPKFGMMPAIQRIDELKVVFDMDHPEYIEKMTDVHVTDGQCYYLQPCDRNDSAFNVRNLKTCIEYIKNNPKWKLSLQTHKLLGIR